MAHTNEGSVPVGNSFQEMEMVLAALTPGLQENIAHGYKHTGAVVYSVSFEILVPPTAGLMMPMWIKASDSTANDTFAIRVDGSVGADFTSAKIRCRVIFLQAASGGISA